MPIVLLAGFAGIPIIEIILFITIGDWIGLWPTIATVVATAVFGATLLRIQGLVALRRFQKSSARNDLLANEVFQGFCLLIAGVLLLIPGFFSDLVGFLLFIPSFRQILMRAILRLIEPYSYFQFDQTSTVDGATIKSGGHQPTNNAEGPVIDGEYEEVRTTGSSPNKLGTDKEA